MFANDIAIALRCIMEQMPLILHIFGRWGDAMGLCLKWRKCELIWTRGEMSDYTAALREMPGAEGLQLVLSATYLEFEVGPQSSATQWDSVLQKIKRRAPDILSAPTALARILNYNIYILSLITFKTQLVPVSHRITK